jgi:hypothetical protein
MNRNKLFLAGAVAAVIVAAAAGSLITWAATKGGGSSARPAALGSPPDNAQQIIDAKKGGNVPAGPHFDQPPPTSCDPSDPANAIAEWRFQPGSLGEAKGKAKDIVLAQVTDVAQGDPIVHDAPGEPGGQDSIPTQVVTLQVSQSYKGSHRPGSTIKLTKLGGPCLRVVEDPGYKQGETDLLMLEDGPHGMMQTVAPEGRYVEQADGTLGSVIPNPGNNPVVSEVAGHKPDDVGPKLRG